MRLMCPTVPKEVYVIGIPFTIYALNQPAKHSSEWRDILIF